jgi:hypothetical protein
VTLGPVRANIKVLVACLRAGTVIAGCALAIHKALTDVDEAAAAAKKAAEADWIGVPPETPEPDTEFDEAAHRTETPEGGTE